MEYPQRKLDLSRSPKLQLLEHLIRLCYFENGTNSDFVLENYNENAWCPRTFDGFACWDDTPAGATAYQHCPEFVVGFDPRRFAYKSYDGSIEVTLDMIVVLSESYNELKISLKENIARKL